jgi:hypothetical protein
VLWHVFKSVAHLSTHFGLVLSQSARSDFKASTHLSSWINATAHAAAVAGLLHETSTAAEVAAIHRAALNVAFL